MEENKPDDQKIMMKYKAFMHCFPALMSLPGAEKKFKTICLYFQDQEIEGPAYSESFAITKDDAWKLVLDVLRGLCDMGEPLAEKFMSDYFKEKQEERKKKTNIKKKRKKKKDFPKNDQGYPENNETEDGGEDIRTD
jgi:hypothetical protein